MEPGEECKVLLQAQVSGQRRGVARVPNSTPYCDHI